MTLGENRDVPEIEYAWLIFDYGGDKNYGLVSTLQLSNMSFRFSLPLKYIELIGWIGWLTIGANNNTMLYLELLNT